MMLDQRINGSTILTGLIGDPVEHTVSPVLHNSLFSCLGINGIYIPLRIEKRNLAAVVGGLKAMGFAGFNVTIPHKEAILDFLDDADDEVKLLGTANTVKIKNGRLIGYNTDGTGFVDSFIKNTGTGFDGKSVCILGGGGTARTLAVKIAAAGAKKIYIINRTGPKAEEIAERINDMFSGEKHAREYAVAAAVLPGTEEARCRMNECDVVINTTSVGMYPHIESSPVGDDVEFSSGTIVYDVIYNPAETRFLAKARMKGCKTCNGAGMLFCQGIRAFEIWMETKVDTTVSDKLSATFLKYLEA